MNPLTFDIPFPTGNLFRFFKAVMCRIGQYNKVFDPVIVTNPVFMMDMLSWKKFATKFLFHFQTVFTYPFRTGPDFNIAGRLIPFRTSGSTVNTAFPSGIISTFIKNGIVFIGKVIAGTRAIFLTRPMRFIWFRTDFTDIFHKMIVAKGGTYVNNR